MMQLEVDLSVLPNGWTLVEPVGEIDVYTAPRLRETLIEAFANGIRHVALSLERVEFIDSTGLGVILGGLERAKRARGDLHVVCDKERFLRLLRVTGLDKTFVVHPSVEALTDDQQAVAAK